MTGSRGGERDVPFTLRSVGEAVADGDVVRLTRLWNSAVGPGRLLYKPLNTTGFRAAFHQAEGDVEKVLVIAESAGAPVGFAAGTRRSGGEVGYLTAIAVAPRWKRRGVGRALLGAVEAGLGDVDRYEVVFFNPVTLSWFVPGSHGHDHPNAPGVDVACEGYLFLKNCGYRDFAHQNSYYLPLADYRYPPDIERKIDALQSDDIRVTRYDASLHQGMDELLDDLGSDDWRQKVTENAARDDGGDPLLIVERHGQVMGFTGPTRVEPSGRGYFAGIGIHSSIRGRGAGKVLFAALCMELKTIGAEFMTLFTGEDNPARNIYEAAGFKIVRSWADMRKKR